MEINKLNRGLRGKKDGPSKKKIIIAVFLLSFAFFGSFLIYFIMQIALNTSTPMVVVVSGSMVPTMYKGDLLFLQGVDPSDLKEGTIEDKKGDIIVYDASDLWDGAPDDPIVHRIVDKWHNESGWWFITKGDANDNVDGYDVDDNPEGVPIPGDRIIGKVVGKIPYIGWVKIVLTESGLLIPLIIILAVPLVISIIMDVFKEEEEEDKKEKKKKFKIKKNLKEKRQSEEDSAKQSKSPEKRSDFDF
ncbi:MAG: signal peptidase I [Promethearchaeota archaeon]